MALKSFLARIKGARGSHAAIVDSNGAKGYGTTTTTPLPGPADDSGFASNVERQDAAPGPPLGYNDGHDPDDDGDDDHAGDLVTAGEGRHLKRGLAERHLSMLGIAGAIGTGLFLGLGGAVQRGGPLGALLGYATVGLVVCAVQFALGEVAALLPVTGAFVRHAEFLVDPAWGFAIGWNLVYGNILSIPSEITAICVLFEFLGYWSVMTGAVFSFAGVESIAMAGAETRNPRKAIPAACKNVFIRIVLFYMLAILIVGMLVSSQDSRLDSESGDATQSPFVIAASAAGIPAIPSVVNAVVITSAWSASNQSLLAGTRVLYGLAVKKQAPRIFLRTTSWGVPYACVFLFMTFSLLSFMSLSSDAITVFWWLVNLTAAGVLVSWISILINHIRLRLAMQKQAIPITRLPWSNSWTCGFAVFTKGNWNASNFVSAYLDIPLVLAAYFIWKFVKKTKIVALADIPLQRAFERADQKYESLAS
ncbi:Dicarboxylic amino acid permease [Metarhizium anisopliae]|nr:Dicarboxylic amino acid permease [Metarhizium anisopliae]